MTPSARIAAALDLLFEIDTIHRPADALVSAFFRARRFIGSKDRGAVSTMVYEVLRHHARLNWWLAKLDQPQTPRNRLIAYMRLVEKDAPGDLEKLFDGTRYGPARITEDEQKIIRGLKYHTLFHPEMGEAIFGECPDWAYASLKRKFGKTLPAELEALLQPAPLDLRINPLKITREKARKALVNHGLKVTETPYSPFGLRVMERPSLGQITLLKEGAIEIQDEGSQLVALLVAPQAGERVVDFCAGAGGKTLALSALMQNKGRIVACDVLENRLKRSGERFRRAGLHNIEIKPLASERDPWVKRHKESFDRVLVDAPCSGAGTWRRNPDARWRSLGPGLEALIPLQASILESASRLVRPGGRLVYATCSLLPEENEQQIQRFLDNHPDYTLLPVKDCGADLSAMPVTGDMLSLSPAVHNTDGFFAAVMTRSAKQPQKTQDQ